MLTVTQQAPFDPKTDPARTYSNTMKQQRFLHSTVVGVSFVSIFIVAYHLVFWVCGAAHSLSWDYLPGVPQGEAAEQRVPWSQKPLGSLITRLLHRGQPVPGCPMKVDDTADTIVEVKVKEKDIESLIIDTAPRLENTDQESDSHLARRTSRISVVPRNSSMEQQTSASVNSLPQPPSPSEHNGQPGPTLEAKNHSLFPHIISRIFQPIFAVINPVTIALLIALPIALIQPLKALFVDVSSLGGPAWKGPDGRPPLAFMIDTGMSILPDLV